MEESIVCKFKNYRVEGEVAILDWYDNLGVIGMHGFDVKSEDEIIDLLNDGGFGAKDILAAKVAIFKIYEHGAKVFWKNLTINVKNPGKKLPARISDVFYEDSLD